MFCENCGTKLESGQRFCINCGTPVTAAPVSAPVPQPEPVTAPHTEVIPTPAPQPAPQAVPAPQSVPQPSAAPVPEAKKGGSKIFRVIVAIAAAAALLIGGIYIGDELLDDDEYHPADNGGSYGEDAPGDSTPQHPEASPGMKYIKLLMQEERVSESGGYSSAYTNYYYNDSHLLTRKEVLTIDGTVYKLFEYTYDEEGNLYSSCVSGDAYGSSKNEALFNPDGTISLFAEYYTDEEDNVYCDHIEYVYTSDGLLDQKLYYYEGEFYERILFIYDENGRVASEERFVLDELDRYVLYYYDDLGQLYHKEYYTPDGVLTYYDNYSYDSNGNMTVDYSQSTEYGWFVRTEYTYDEDGNCLSWIEHTDVQSSALIKWTYDENGNKLDEKRYADDGSVSGGWYEWTYDEDGFVSEMRWNSNGSGLDVFTYYNYEYVEVPEDFEAPELVDIQQYDE